MNTSLILWVIPGVALLGAFLLIARQMRAATSKGQSFGSMCGLKPGPTLEISNATSRASAEPRFDPPSRENLARICSWSGIRVISILPTTRRPRGQAEENVEILVEFEPEANLDYAVVFRLRQELSAIFGRRVDLVCRNSAELAAPQEIFEKARVLYAA